MAHRQNAIFRECCLIIIPTYNEAENIEPLVDQLLIKASGKTDILIVDDNSPDGTGSIADRLTKRNPRIHVIHRADKLGLGSAYRTGFAWGMERGFNHFFQMDSDFSHDPKHLPEFQQALHNNECDVVIGSRYVPGGAIENWGLLRHLLSRFAGVYSRFWLGMQTKDMTTGYMGWRREVLERVGYENMTNDGYCFLIQLKFNAFKNGFRFKEFPIVFLDRKRGKSKLSKSIIWEAVWQVPWMALTAKKR